MDCPVLAIPLMNFNIVLKKRLVFPNFITLRLTKSPFSFCPLSCLRLVAFILSNFQKIRLST